MFWDAPLDAGLTASELVEESGLTRATVLAICDDLRELGWVTEDRAPSSVPGRGRQARRFTFNRTRSLVAAADVGIRSVTSGVTDLKGVMYGRAQHLFDDDGWEIDRTDHLIQTLQESLDAADVSVDQIGEACIGVAAPTDERGAPFPGNPYWDLVRIDRRRVLSYAPAWHLDVENDADLAALAELSAAGDSPSPLVTLLASERLGAGITINGEIVRGAHGGAGELAFLERVEGAGTSLGITGNARLLASETMAQEPGWKLAAEGLPPLGAILAAAADGDLLAVKIRGQLEEHLAVTITTVASVIAPAVVIIAGGSAEAAGPLVPRVQARLAELLAYPPRVRVSQLGRDVVLGGAAQRAIMRVRGAAGATWVRP